MARLDYFSDGDEEEEEEEEETDIEISPEIIKIIFKEASLDKFIIYANEWVKANNAKVLNDIVDYNDKTHSFENFCSFLELNKEQIDNLKTAINNFYYAYPEHKKIPVKSAPSS